MPTGVVPKSKLQFLFTQAMKATSNGLRRTPDSCSIMHHISKLFLFSSRYFPAFGEGFGVSVLVGEQCLGPFLFERCCGQAHGCACSGPDLTTVN